jgi:two-component system phosphate regulon response regulator PhoB
VKGARLRWISRAAKTLFAVRSVVFRFGDIAALLDALEDAKGALALPEGAGDVKDGEWVLACFEIGSRKRATAAAARAVRAAGDAHLAFERRDWERLLAFVSARSEHMRVARPVSAAPDSAGRDPGQDGRVDSGFAASDMPAPSSRAPLAARVLLVDDDAATRDGVRQTLAEVGLRVDVATTVQEASAQLEASAYDALVVDMHVKGRSTLDLVRELRRSEGGAGLPVLVLADGATARDVVDAFASGGDDFLAKPFRAPELGARVIGLLRRAGAKGTTGRHPAVGGGA